MAVAGVLVPAAARVPEGRSWVCYRCMLQATKSYTTHTSCLRVPAAADHYLVPPPPATAAAAVHDMTTVMQAQQLLTPAHPVVPGAGTWPSCLPVPSVTRGL
jgi:hypothetical protein